MTKRSQESRASFFGGQEHEDPCVVPIVFGPTRRERTLSSFFSVIETPENELVRLVENEHLGTSSSPGRGLLNANAGSSPLLGLALK